MASRFEVSRTRAPLSLPLVSKDGSRPGAGVGTALGWTLAAPFAVGKLNTMISGDAVPIGEGDSTCDAAGSA